MTEYLQHMINMLILGSTYALLGIGLTLIFGIIRIVNFAHGELYASGAYFVYFVAVLLGSNFFLSPLPAAVAGWLVGSLIAVVLLLPRRAVDSDTAELIGVNMHAIYMAPFAIGSGLAAAAGALLGPVYVISPQMGNIASLKAFAIVILGGLGSIGGATIGGFILAFAEEMGAGYVSSGYRDAMGFLLIMAVLLFKPTGLFARSERVG